MDWQLLLTALIVMAALAFTIRRFVGKPRPKKPDAIDVPADRLIRSAKSKKNTQN